METYSARKQNLIALADRLSELASRGRQPGSDSERSVDPWQERCREVSRLLTDEVLKVAVVGTIKSGKSTLINSWLGGDHLKRGAGVVTSIVTRVRKGEALRATLRFKSWDEVNADIESALSLLPASGWRRVEDRFDLRRDKDREDLQAALATLETDQLVSEDTRNLKSVYLSSYAAGYDRIRPHILSDSSEIVFHDDGFSGHREFVGDEILAVYVKDIVIEYPDGLLEDGMEIADCQGTDAPNPLHLAQVQDYLQQAHLLVYVISSRTGLRQADLRFLGIIRKMGILDQTLFVLNADFGEHDHIDDVTRLQEKVRGELAMLAPDAKVHVFSALYRLLSALEPKVSEKDNLRLAQWRSDAEMCKASEEASNAFDREFGDILTRDRARLLVANHAVRLGNVAAAIENRCRIALEILDKGREATREVAESLKYQQVRVDQVRSLIESTLNGAKGTVEGKLRKDLDAFFDPAAGDILPGIFGFIRSWRPELSKYREVQDASGFSVALYHAFQDFHQDLDDYMTSRVNPEIVRFIRKQEREMAEEYVQVARPYASMVRDAAFGYGESLSRLGIVAATAQDAETELFASPRDIADQIGLMLPPASAVTRYSARVKAEGRIRFGFYQAVRAMMTFFKKDVDGFDEAGRAMADSLKQLRLETEKGVAAHFVDYRENVKFQYTLKLSGAVLKQIRESLSGRFDACVADLEAVDTSASRTREEQARTRSVLEKTVSDCQAVAREIDRFCSAL